MVLRRFQGAVARSLGLSCWDHGGRLEACPTQLPRLTMRPALASSFGSISVRPPLSRSLQAMLAPLLIIPAKHGEVGGYRRSGSAFDLLWNPGLLPASLWASVSLSVAEGLQLIRLPKALPALPSYSLGLEGTIFTP